MSAEVVAIRPRANARGTCSTPGCEIDSKANGLCNTHYMEFYRSSLRELLAEVRGVVRVHGDADGYFCEYAGCEGVAAKWYVKNGQTPMALCSQHTSTIADSLRMEIRRLELKP